MLAYYPLAGVLDNNGLATEVFDVPRLRIGPGPDITFTFAQNIRPAVDKRYNRRWKWKDNLPS